MLLMIDAKSGIFVPVSEVGCGGTALSKFCCACWCASSWLANALPMLMKAISCGEKVNKFLVK